jgi:penicillin amidase
VRRVFKYTNAVVLSLLAMALLAAAAFIWRSLPETEGELRLDVRQPVEVVRDQYGIPHITAANVEDAIYAQGYVHAQDRFWQMEATRRLAAGEMAELVGRVALESDVAARQLRLRRVAMQMADNLEPEDRLWLAAYARGVNDWLKQNQNRLPLEIQALRYTPRTWQVADSLLLVLHMFRQLSNSWTTEADQFLLVSQAADKQLARELFPTRTGTEIMPGSNAWVLSGARSVTGKPILAGDPHLQQSWPATFYLNHLKAGDLDVVGGSLPGGPGIVIGHNQEIAWSMTTLHFDVQDLYYNDNALIATERETIRVKGAPDVELNLQITPHGPIVERNGMRFALRWTAFEGKFPFAFRRLNLARNWAEFRTALSHFAGPAHNFVYADREGNTGYQAAGWMPLRQTVESSLPLDARNPVNEWRGYIPFDKLPSVLNPAGGLIVNANQNPFPQDYEYPVAGIFTPPYRQAQIVKRLGAKAKWAPAEMTAIQMDVYSAFHHFLAGQLAAAGKQRKQAREDLKLAVEVLEGWNGQMEAGLAAPMITALAYEELKRRVMRRVTNLPLGLDSHFAPSIVEDMLRKRPQRWFADYDQVLVECLLAALDAGKAQQGRNPKFWDYGRYSRITISNPVLGEAIAVGKLLTPAWMPFAESLRTLRLPLVDGLVQVGPLPLSGAAQTVKQVSARIGPAFRFVADTADWDNSTMTITLGQSGHIFSRHSKDYWESYYSGGSVPLPYKKIEPKATLRFRPE